MGCSFGPSLPVSFGKTKNMKAKTAAPMASRRTIELRSMGMRRKRRARRGTLAT